MHGIIFGIRNIQNETIAMRYSFYKIQWGSQYFNKIKVTDRNNIFLLRFEWREKEREIKCAEIVL